MELPILLLCISLIFCCFFIKPLVLNSKSSRKLPPGPTGLPIIGSLLNLGSRPNRSLAELAKIHGPLMTLKLGSVTTVIASSPETAKEILQKHDKTFSACVVPDAVTAQPNPEATMAWVPADNYGGTREGHVTRRCSLTNGSIHLKNFVTRRLNNLSVISENCVRMACPLT
ncbi:hypothetical protein FXO38_28778 [Capsicum annuum]|nr:hypothetical protein FXO38_28778 [Capsicum annuum]